MAKKISAETFFSNNNLFEFIKYKDIKTEKLSVISSDNKYILKCKICGEDNDKTGNSKILLKCTNCKSYLTPSDEDKDKSIKDYDLTKATLTIIEKKTKIVKEKIVKESTIKNKEDKKKLQEKIDQQIVDKMVAEKKLKKNKTDEVDEKVEQVDEKVDEKVDEVVVDEEVDKVEDGLDYKFYDTRYIVNVKDGETDALKDGRNITTDKKKKNLINHIYIPKNKALVIDKFIFTNKTFSLFDNFKTIGSVQEVVIKKNISSSLQPYELIKLNEKNKIAPKDYFTEINKYFKCELEYAAESTVIFNSSIKWNWTLISDEDITIKCNPAKAYIISLMISLDDDEVDVVRASRLSMKKLTSNKELDLSEALILFLNEKFDESEEIANIEYSYTIKQYGFKNRETPKIKEFRKFIDVKETNKVSFVFNPLEIKAFKLIMDISD